MPFWSSLATSPYYLTTGLASSFFLYMRRNGFPFMTPMVLNDLRRLTFVDSIKNRRDISNRYLTSFQFKGSKSNFCMKFSGSRKRAYLGTLVCHCRLQLCIKGCNPSWFQGGNSGFLGGNAVIRCNWEANFVDRPEF